MLNEVVRVNFCVCVCVCREKLCKKTLYSCIGLIWEIPKKCLLTPNFLLFLLVWRLYKVFFRQFWCVRVVHLHSAPRALSSTSRCFQLSTNLDKDLFRCLLCWDATTLFTNAKRLLTSCEFLSHSETWHCENKIDKEFW